MPNQGFTVDSPSIRCFCISENPLFEPMCESSHCHLEELCASSTFFQISPTIYGKQIVINHSELIGLYCSNATVVMLPSMLKKQANICFDMLLARTIFLDFACFGKPIQLTTFFIHLICITASDALRKHFVSIFFHQSRRAFF